MQFNACDTELLFGINYVLMHTHLTRCEMIIGCHEVLAPGSWIPAPSKYCCVSSTWFWSTAHTVLPEQPVTYLFSLNSVSQCNQPYIYTLGEQSLALSHTKSVILLALKSMCGCCCCNRSSLFKHGNTKMTEYKCCHIESN